MKKQFKLSATARNAWMRKEEGSWEDHDKPTPGHIYPVLQNNWKKGTLTANTDEELKLISRSAQYQTTWEMGESDSTDTLIKEASRI